MRNWKRRWFNLDAKRGGVLTYADSPEGFVRGDFKGVIHLRSVTRVEPRSAVAPTRAQRPLAFEIVTRARTYHVAAEVQVQKDEWLLALNRALGLSTSSHKLPLCSSAGPK